jgi:pyruvate ferredoxin oxidoreductase gamma subunit
MFRIRFHGRGGQGMKTASRVLGTAFFIEGYEVQDAPLYGAERRGAPVFASVRADKTSINERGIMRAPDLVAVADDTLVSLSSANVGSGASGKTVLLVRSELAPDVWKGRLNFPGTVLAIPPTSEPKLSGMVMASASSALVKVIKRASLERAVREELAHLGPKAIEKSLVPALETFDLMSRYSGAVTEGPAPADFEPASPDWVELGFEDADVSAPSIRAEATSELTKTGLWRTVKPVIDYVACNRCWWLCSTYCPEGAIKVGPDGRPEIDYDHCKGCLICMAQCPADAISAQPEHREDAK